MKLKNVCHISTSVFLASAVPYNYTAITEEAGNLFPKISNKNSNNHGSEWVKHDSVSGAQTGCNIITA